MFILSFFRYLRPHGLRLAFGVFCLLGVGFVGTYNIILAKPALDVLFGEEKVEKRRQEYEEKIEQKRLKIEENARSEERSKRFAAWAQGLAFSWEAKGRRLLIRFYEYADASVVNKINCLWAIAALMIASTLLNGLFDYGSQYNLSFSLYSAVMALQNDMFRSVMKQDMAYFGKHPVGYLISRISSDIANVRRFLEYLIRDLLREGIRLFFIVSLLLYLSWKMTLVAFVGLLPAVALLLFFARVLKRVTRKEKKRSDRLSASAVESLENIRLVKALTSENIESGRFEDQNFKIFQLEMKRRVARFAASPLMVFLGSIGLSAILLLGGYVVLGKNETGSFGAFAQMDASTFIIYVIALGQLYQPLKRLGSINVTWQNARVSTERIHEILRMEPGITDPPEDLPPVRLSGIEKGIALRDVSFSYSDKVVLRDLNLEIRKGATTAIVGRSGSGKSTLANLLLRFFDPDKGQIEIDGVDLRHMRIKDLRALFGIVTQETLLFNDTIAQNIAYGANGATPEKIVESGRAANAHDFIMELDGGQGYDTVIGPRGCNLSGGQRQRIAIARAFCRDPHILVLDEATSALDNESESAVQQAFQQLMAHRTVIVIAHRLTTIMHADTIVVLDGGRIVEQGRHAELLAKGSHYANLYRLGEFAET